MSACIDERAPCVHKQNHFAAPNSTLISLADINTHALKRSLLVLSYHLTEHQQIFSLSAKQSVV